MGGIERDSGNLRAAAAAYHESLEISRQLRAQLGDTPQALRDVSYSLKQLGNVERDDGNLLASLAAYRESLACLRQCWAMLGNTPPVLKDLLIILRAMIELEQQAGDPEIAASLQREMGEIEAMLAVSDEHDDGDGSLDS